MFEIWLLLGMGALLVVIWAISWIIGRRELVAARHVASSWGFELDTSVNEPPDVGLDLFEHGRRRRATMRFSRPGGSTTVFSYRYRTGSTRNKRVHHHTCALVALPFAAPHTKIGLRGSWNGIGRTPNVRDVSVHAPGLDERFTVDTDDERFAKAMFDARAAEWLMRGEGGPRMRYELRGPWLACITYVIDAEALPAFHDWAAAIPEHLPDTLTWSYPIRQA